MNLANELQNETKDYILQQNDMNLIDYSAVWVEFINKIFPDLTVMPPDQVLYRMQNAAEIGQNEIQFTVSSCNPFESRRYVKRLDADMYDKLIQLIEISEQYGDGLFTCQPEFDDEVVIRFWTNSRWNNSNIISCNYRTSSYYKITFDRLDARDHTVEMNVRIHMALPDCIKLLQQQGFMVESNESSNELTISWDFNWMKLYKRIKEEQSNG